MVKFLVMVTPVESMVNHGLNNLLRLQILTKSIENHSQIIANHLCNVDHGQKAWLTVTV